MVEKIEISYKTIVFTVFLLIGIWFIYAIHQTLLLFFVCIIFTSALSPIVEKLCARKIPRPLAISLIYIVLVGGFLASVASILPLLVTQTGALINDLPKLIDKINIFNFHFDPSDYNGQLVNLPANLFKIAISTFSDLVRLFAFFVLNFYLLMERQNLKKHLHFLFAENGEKKIEMIILELERKLGGWVRGELLLMFIVGMLTYIGLRLLDLSFAFPLALIAGFLELIPNIGPTVSMIPALIIGFSTSPIIGCAVLALYFLVQQLENNLIVPKVMQETVGLHPLITLAALMIGFRIGGVVGILLAVPTLIFLRVFIEQYYHLRKLPPKNT